MILPDMTYEQVADQYLADLLRIAAKRKYLQQKFAGLVKRSRSKTWPLTAQYEYLCPGSKNRYLICYTAFKRSDWHEPYCNAICIYEGKGGKYAVTTANNLKTLIVFTPHFFARYRERILDGEELHGDALIKRYMSRNTRFIAKPIDESFARAYRKYEDNESQTFAATVNEGNIFLKEYNGSIVVCKTILSDEMLHENQTEAFGELKDELKRLGHFKVQGYEDYYSQKQ